MEFAISANFRQSRSKLTPITPTVETTIVRLPSNPKSKKRFTSVRSSDSDFNDSSDQSLGSPAFALHQSIFEGRFKQIHYFLKMGLSANSKDMYGRTSLMIACLCDFEEYGIQVTKLLMKYGADINVKDSLGQSVAYLAVSERRDNYFSFLMDNYSVSIDYKQKDNDGNCLLNHVAQKGNAQMLRKVIETMQERKIELDVRNTNGFSALLLAIQADRYLNAYVLLSKGNCSPSIQDNVRYFNALAWLLDRIKINKNCILNNRFKAKRRGLSSNSMPYSASQYSDLDSPDLVLYNGHRKVNPLKLRSINNCNQYFKSEGSCDHTITPNYSVEHHKSRYVPAVLQSQYTHYLQSAVASRRKEPTVSRVITAKSHISEKEKSEEDENEIEIIVDENTELKVLIQKLYELIFMRMSESYRAKQFYSTTSGVYKPQSPTIKENETGSKENKTTGKRTTPRAQSQNKKLVSQVSSNSLVKMEDAPKQADEQISSVSTKSIIENPMESNIFNTEKNRKTPKLRAIQPVYEDEKTTKDAVHSMLSLYVSNQSFGCGLNGTNSSFAHEGWGHVTPFGNEKIDGVKSKANSMYKEKSSMSEKSRKRSLVSANSHVHFN